MFGPTSLAPLIQVHFVAFCQGMLGLQNVFANQTKVFRMKPPNAKLLAGLRRFRHTEPARVPRQAQETEEVSFQTLSELARQRAAGKKRTEPIQILGPAVGF